MLAVVSLVLNISLLASPQTRAKIVLALVWGVTAIGKWRGSRVPQPIADLLDMEVAPERVAAVAPTRSAPPPPPPRRTAPAAPAAPPMAASKLTTFNLILF